jgi:hypothetical protein
MPQDLPEELPCRCTDPQCSFCQGHCGEEATGILYRIDMEDATGTPMCDDCAEDAMSSGVFATDEER